jgi:protein SCO1/2
MKGARRRTLAIAIFAAVAAGIGVAFWLRTPTLELAAGTALPEPRKIEPFALTDQQGHILDAAALRGRWTLLFTGFTHCPDICPTTLATLAELDERLGPAAPRFLFVSVDPERDTPERIAAYLRHFDPDLLGATGSREAIESFTRGLGLAQVRNPGVGDEYTVDHSAALVLIDPRARLAGYFQPPYDVDALEADLARLPGG